MLLMHVIIADVIVMAQAMTWVMDTETPRTMEAVVMDAIVTRTHHTHSHINISNIQI